MLVFGQAQKPGLPRNTRNNAHTQVIRAAALLSSIAGARAWIAGRFSR